MTLMLIVQFLVLTFVVSGVIIFFLKKTLIDSTNGAVHRLNSETEQVRAKQAELNEKIKMANEELEKRRNEAQELVNKMKQEAEDAALAEREKLLNRARLEGEDIINKAQRTKDQMRAVIQKELELNMVDYTKQLLTEVLSTKALKLMDHQLIAEFIDSVSKMEMDMVAPEVKTIELITSTEMDPALREKLLSTVHKRLGRELKVEPQIAAEVIAGVIIKFGSLVLDGSLQNMLKEKATDMKEKIERS